VAANIKSKYMSIGLPEPDLLYALVFGLPIRHDTRVMDHIKDSVFTNALDSTQLKTGSTVVPEASPFMLQLGGIKGQDEGSTARLLSDIVTMAFLHQEGDVAGSILERILYRWIKVKFSAAIRGEGGAPLAGGPVQEQQRGVARRCADRA
jgi:hypothetical protein